jgi:mRNA interferase MazF
VSAAAYVPRRGDIVRIDLNPQAGHEQAGRRPAVVLSPGTYNGKAGLAVFCPVTTQIKGYPFEVSVPEGLPVSGVVLADQVRTMDWRARRAEFVCSLPAAVIGEILGKLRTLLD